MPYARAIDGRARKSEILGIPIGTASNRLRKLVMFDLVGRLGLATCFRCGEAIENADDLSIDHKDAWRAAVDPLAAFMCVGNIAFSHLICNSLATAPRIKKYPTVHEYKAAKRKRWYAKNSEGFNTRRRERRAALHT